MKPTVNIAVLKNRQREFTSDNQRVVYLQNGNEFQLEFFNPTQKNLLAKIKINGNYISNTGLIVRPGERVWLDRYLDVAKKFKFDTYMVENGNSEVEAAIAKNGLVEVEFYDEKEKPKPAICNPIIWDGSWPWNRGTGGWNYPYYYDYNHEWNGVPCNPSFTTSNNSESITLDCLDDLNFNLGDAEPISKCFYSAEVNFMDLKQEKASFSTNSMRSFAPPQRRRKTLKSTKETGRIEAGSTSSQTFETLDIDFNTWTSSVEVIKLMPLSQQPVTSETVRVKYCTQCGTKMKKTSWKFCPNCGAQA